RQRITFSYRLRPLDVSDAQRYLQERLAVTGYRGEPLCQRAAVRRLVRGSGGIARLLNILAHKCLMAAFGEGKRRVPVRHVRRALAETEGARPGSAHRLRWRLFGCALPLVGLLGAWPWREQLPKVLP